MAIDCELETIISFTDARSAFPGIDRRLSLATLHRWRLTGVRGANQDGLQLDAPDSIEPPSVQSGER